MAGLGSSESLDVGWDSFEGQFLWGNCVEATLFWSKTSWHGDEDELDRSFDMRKDSLKAGELWQ